MARPDSHIQEDIHRSYVSAIVASAGFQISSADTKEYGSDLIATKVKKLPSGKYTATGINLVIQLKSSMNVWYENNSVIYDMEVDAINKIAEWEGSSPCILVLFKMPKNRMDWIKVNENGLLLRDCCFWFKISESTTNSSTQRIKIPRCNIFDESAVGRIFDHINDWESL